MNIPEWTQHPGGLRSRPLPDVLPIIDQNQGFTPPFAIDIHERPTRDIFTAHTCKTLVEAARLASREFNCRRYMRSMAIELTDGRCRAV